MLQSDCRDSLLVQCAGRVTMRRACPWPDQRMPAPYRCTHYGAGRHGKRCAPSDARIVNSRRSWFWTIAPWQHFHGRCA